MPLHPDGLLSNRPENQVQDIEALRERLSRLNESLDLETVLQGALDSARSLTGARYGVITLLDDDGQVQDFLSSTMTGEEARQI